MRKYLGKGLALAVCLIMVLGTVLPYAFADSTEQTQTSSVQIGAYKQATDTSNITKTTGLATTGFENEYEKGLVKVSKTISGTDTENVFDVTLTVKTGQKIKDTHDENKQAVVLVIDCSGSMSYCICGDKNCKYKDNNNTTHKSKLMAVKEAVRAFVNEFSGEKSITDKKIAVVTFSNNAKAEEFSWSVQGWSGKNWLSINEMNSDRITNITNRLRADGATNIEDALKKANQLLGQQEVKDYNKSVILLSDGVPTYHNNEYGPGYSGGGDETEHNDHYKAEVAANALAGDVNKYAIYAGSDNDKISCTSNQGNSYEPGSHKPSSNCDLGNNTTVTQWLSNKCGFTTKSTQDATELVDIFKTVAKMIAVKAKAWIVEDPMGSNIDYISFAQGSSSNASYADKKITWNLKHDIPTEDKDNNEFVYTLKYQVKLDTLKMTDFSKFEDVNGNALLKYYMDEYFVDEEGSHEDNSGNLVLSTAYFNIPTVKGFAGTLSFTKTDENRNPLSGATFKLTTKDSSTWNMTATSDKDGKVTFNNIPSGHIYTLTETNAPTGYEKTSEAYTVKVDYGECTVTKSGDEDSTKISNLQVINTLATGSLTITKTTSGGTTPNDAVFTLTNADGATAGTARYSQFVNGSYTFTNLPLGEYTVRETNADVSEYNLTTTYNVGETETATATVTADSTATIAISNVYEAIPPTIPITPTVKYKDVTVSKVWTDVPADVELPAQVNITLYRNGYVYKTVTLNAQNNWKAEVSVIDDLAIYTVDELAVPVGYEKSIDGLTVTNKYVVEDEPIVDPDDTPTVNPDDGNKPAADVDKDDSNGNKDNNDKNKDKVVKTGDTTGMTMTWGVFAATLLGLGGLLLRRRVHK